MAIEAGLLHVIGEKNGESINTQALAEATGYDALLIGTTIYTDFRVSWLMLRNAQLESCGLLLTLDTAMKSAKMSTVPMK